MAIIVPTILLHFLRSLPASSATAPALIYLLRHLCLHVHRPWRSDVGGTTTRKLEVELRLEQQPRITSGTRLQGRRRYEPMDGRGRAKHDCMDAGGRATHGAFAEDARAESDAWSNYRVIETTVFREYSSLTPIN